MKIHFVKMQASGNDFILIDEFNSIVIPGEKKPEFVVKASDRHFGIGSDGVIFVQPSEDSDARFVFYNPDGSKAEMCGNGIRCFTKYLYEGGISRKQKIRMETLKGVITSYPIAKDGVVGEVRVDMGAPLLKRKEIPVAGRPGDTFIDQAVEVKGRLYRLTAVGMGNPHVVLFLDDLRNLKVKKIGRGIREHRELFPNGVNVHFVQEIKENEFRIRSYERGVEDETLACGTGICASAVAAVLNKLADKGKPIIFHARGGDLQVGLELDGEGISKVFLTGPVEEVFRGEMVF
ncbi:MAG: diaminopimelate epimerase [Candidatus Altiarchaeota archaeon]|nr:diaminopimelate epimerase [Candidatus Altiarchaeota archaeon]